MSVPVRCFHAQMRVRADAIGAVVHRAGLGLGERDQFLCAVRLHRRVHHQHRRAAAQHHDRGEVLRTVGQLAEVRVGRDGRIRCDEQGKPIGRRARHRLGADGAVAARAVVDDDGLTDLLGQSLRHDARHRVGDAAGRGRHDQPHLAVRIGLRVCRATGDGEGGQQRAGAERLCERQHRGLSSQRALAMPSTGLPMPSGLASTSTKATRARTLLRLAQA